MRGDSVISFGLFVILISSMFFVSFVTSGSQSQQFADYCVDPPQDKSNDCYIGSCGAKKEDIAYIIGSDAKCHVTTRCNQQGQLEHYYRSDPMNQEIRDRCDPSSGACCGDHFHDCQYLIEDCRGNGGKCMGKPRPHCCYVTTTCDDFAKRQQKQCGRDLSVQCGETIDCLTRPKAVCNTKTQLYRCEDNSKHRNCDGDWVNGCETAIRNDVKNCGGCGITCSQGQTCSGGKCRGGNDGDGDDDDGDKKDPNMWLNMFGSPISWARVGDYVRFGSDYDDDSSTYIIQRGSQTIHQSYGKKYFEIKSVSEDGFRFKVKDVANSYSGRLVTKALPRGDLPFTLDIISPHCGNDYNKGSIIRARVRMNERDDFVQGTLQIGSKTVSFDNAESNLFEYNYTANTPGSIKIIADANNTAGEEYRATSNIIVYDSTDTSEQKYVVACIDEPENLAVLDSPNVNFKAHSTKGIVFTGNGGSGGNKVELTPNELYFVWTFLYSNGQQVVCEGIGSEPCPGDLTPGATKYDFVKKFPTVNDNYATLTVQV